MTPSFCGALLAAKPRLNLIAHGETPLFYAARLKRLKTLALLIEAGADPSIPDRQGRDAVAIARARRLPKPVDRAARGGAGAHLNPAVLRAAAGGVNVVASAVDAGPKEVTPC